MRSTPVCFNSPASLTESLIFQPPSTQSVDEMRRNNGNSFGHSDRTAATISRQSRVRFSNEPPVIVRAFITKRGQKLVNEITVRGVDLDDTEPSLTCAARGCGKSGDHYLNAFIR